MLNEMDLFGKGIRFLKRNWRKALHVYECLNLKKHYYTSLLSYAHECPSMVDDLSVRSVQVFYSMPTFYGEDIKPLRVGGYSLIKAASINNVCCFNHSDFLLLNDGRLINDHRELAYLARLSDLSDGVLMQEATNWCKLNIPSETVIIPEAIKIGGMFGFNYYHFTIQLLPKFFEIERIDQGVPILVDSSAMSIKTFREMIDICNVCNRKVISMSSEKKYMVKKLHYITNPNYLIPNLKKGAIKIDKSAVFYPDYIIKLRCLFLQHKANIESPRYVFISRRDATKRRPFNESACMSALRSLGFSEICPEKYSFFEQVAIFNNADIIVGGAGAAFTNILYCRKNAKVLILKNYKSKFPDFSSIASILDLTLLYLYDRKLGIRSEVKQGDEHKGYNIDVVELKRCVEELMNQ